MNHTIILRRKNLTALLAGCLAAARKVYAPVRKNEVVTFQSIDDPAHITLDYIQTVQSAKHVLFPRAEELFRYSTDENNQLRLEDRDVNSFEETVIFGVRPCDASGFLTLEAVFTWDYPDAFYLARREKCTIISIACQQADPWCFCTSVGGGPGHSRGSDLLLLPLAEGDYLVEVVSDKGRHFVTEFAAHFESQPAEATVQRLAVADVPLRFDLEKLQTRLPALFNSDIWTKQAQACLGCGACAFLCPSCVCFDIQDEGTQENGIRLRCWDSCGFSLFTLHTSGHNPRSEQCQRWRQRVMHKFSYLPDRLKIMGCVGCGRCLRTCPAGMDLVECLTAIAEVSA